MSTFTTSQLNTKETDYTLQDTDLLLASIGTSTADLSSIKMSFQQFAQLYVFTQYALEHGITITGGVSAQGGLSANQSGEWTINFKGLPTADTNCKTGDLFTQTETEVAAGGSNKVICVK